MKTIIKLAIAAAAFIAPAGMESLLAQESTSNYIMTTTHLSADSTSMSRRVVSYHDGLGRPVQTLYRGTTANESDLADRTEYDSLGRAYRTWNTVAAASNGGHQVSADSVTAKARCLYSDNSPFSETQYDGSPLDRIRKVTGPGQAWHAAGKGVRSGYLTNTAADSLKCRKFGISLSGDTGITFSNDGSFSTGALMVDRTEDEDGRTLWVFKDMRGLTLLERRLAKAAAGNTAAVYADTYYLYDLAGRLVAVLPPELSKYFSSGSWSGSTGSDAKVEGLAYQYRYDARGRMIAKKLPGAAWTYFIYDKGDRLVLTQDGNQRERSEWSFRVQDALGRECLTGVLTGTYNAFGNPLGSVQVVAARDRNAEIYGDLHGYLVSGLTIPYGAEVLTVSWWDDYTFLGREADMPGSSYGYSVPPSGSGYGVQYAGGAQGLLTGRWSKSLGEVRTDVGAAVCETWAYDDHGRTVFHVKGYPSGKRVVERSGYDFVGNLTSLGKTLYDEGTTSHTEAYTYTYDNWGRPLTTTHRLDGGTVTTLSSNSYDAVGRLSGTSRGGSSALASTYTYNVRNWLTGIGGTLFSETLTYETPRTGSALPGQWGGNISGFQTSTVGSQTMRYDFGYDLLGRLTDANYGGSNSSTMLAHSRTYGYDLNGNMTERRSKEGAGLYQGAWLEWTWNMGDGNRPGTWHQQRTFLEQYNPQYPSGTAEVADAGYAYDGMGNRTAELDGQGDTLKVLRYNLLNLPEEYVSSGGETVRYVYSADGEKLYVQQTAPSIVPKGTEYAANYRIDNGTISMIHTDAGYYTPMLPGGSGYEHVWSLKDHLGNTRVLASKRGGSLASYHYDPFGEGIDVILNPPSSVFPYDAKESPYRYGGKEWSGTTSTYDFEARYLSPSFHRFTTMDPMCEKYYGISPYAYCANDPVNLMDPSGETIRIRRNQKNALYDLAKIAATNRGSRFLSRLSFESEQVYDLEPVYLSRHAGFTGTKINYVINPVRWADGGSPSEFVYMGHELSHANDYDRGYVPMKNDGTPVVNTAPTESNAVTFENYLRSVYRLPFLRKGYSGFVKGKEGFDPDVFRTKGERIARFEKKDSNSSGTAFGFSYEKTIGKKTSQEYIIVGVNDNQEFYYHKYTNEEDYNKAVSEW